MKSLFELIRSCGGCILALALSSVLLFAGGCGASRIIQLPEKNEIMKEELAYELEDADVVFVGEIHDKQSHHRMQLSVIKAFHEADLPIAIGMEMFRAESQESLDKWVSGEMGREEFMKAYYQNWRIPWPLYSEIFEYAREHKIPIIGLNAPSDIVKKVFKGGMDSLTPEEKRKLPYISCEIDESYKELLKDAMKDHEMDEKSFENFCEAQMVWDTVMAERILEYLDKNPGSKMIVLAGAGHSWKRGIPEQVRRKSRVPYLVLLPEMPGSADEDLTHEDTDYVWLNP